MPGIFVRRGFGPLHGPVTYNCDQPSDKIAESPLHRFWCKFRYPMVLSVISSAPEQLLGSRLNTYPPLVGDIEDISARLATMGRKPIAVHMNE